MSLDNLASADLIEDLLKLGVAMLAHLRSMTSHFVISTRCIRGFQYWPGCGRSHDPVRMRCCVVTSNITPNTASPSVAETATFIVWNCALHVTMCISRGECCRSKVCSLPETTRLQLRGEGHWSSRTIEGRIWWSHTFSGRVAPVKVNSFNVVCVLCATARHFWVMPVDVPHIYLSQSVNLFVTRACPVCETCIA